MPERARRFEREGYGAEGAPDPLAAVLADGRFVGLTHAGWDAAADVAGPIAVRRGEDRLVPGAVVDGLRSRDLTADAWRAQAEELGIADVSLEVRWREDHEPVTRVQAQA